MSTLVDGFAFVEQLRSLLATSFIENLDRTFYKISYSSLLLVSGGSFTDNNGRIGDTMLERNRRDPI